LEDEGSSQWKSGAIARGVGKKKGARHKFSGLQEPVTMSLFTIEGEVKLVVSRNLDPDATNLLNALKISA
jgi:hypothetical protein